MLFLVCPSTGLSIHPRLADIGGTRFWRIDAHGRLGELI